VLEYWQDDPHTGVVLLYLESFGNPRNFARIARSVSERKPVIAVHAGRSGAGARAAASHTGASVAASGAAVDAAAVFACAKEIPLIAEVGTQRRTVGSIGGGVHLRTAATAEPELVTVQFPDGAAAAVTPLKGTRLLVRRADVAACPGFNTN